MAVSKPSQSSSTTKSSFDPYKFLKIVPNADGSLTRLNPIPNIPPTETPTTNINPNSNSPQLTLSKDIPLNPSKNTFLGILKPYPIPPNSKLPLIIYFHGGGFVPFSASFLPFHDSCNRMALLFCTIVVSVDYHLSLEHCLPAAYYDAVDAIMWAKNQAKNITGCHDSWLNENDAVDFSTCFLMGSSSGANNAYFVALRVLDYDTLPLKIWRLVFHQPYFGGVLRSQSEMRFVHDRILLLSANDLLWGLALPEGVLYGGLLQDRILGGKYITGRTLGERLLKFMS